MPNGNLLSCPQPSGFFSQLTQQGVYHYIIFIRIPLVTYDQTYLRSIIIISLPSTCFIGAVEPEYL